MSNNPYEPPKEQNESPAPYGLGPEIREWLGLTVADVLVYVGMASAVAVFFVANSIADIALASLAIVLVIAACRIGMKPDHRVSDATNMIKLIAYPACVVVVIGILTAGFLFPMEQLQRAFP